METYMERSAFRAWACARLRVCAHPWVHVHCGRVHCAVCAYARVPERGRTPCVCKCRVRGDPAGQALGPRFSWVYASRSAKNQAQAELAALRPPDPSAPAGAAPCRSCSHLTRPCRFPHHRWSPPPGPPQDRVTAVLRARAPRPQLLAASPRTGWLLPAGTRAPAASRRTAGSATIRFHIPLSVNTGLFPLFLF